MSTSSRLQTIVNVATLIALAVACASLAQTFIRHEGHLKGEASEPVTDLAAGTDISLDGVPVLGQETAAVIMIEFSDYHCPFCIRFAERSFPTLRDQFIATGKLRYGFLHHPLRSRELSRWSICAAQQGRFWQAHERLFGAGLEGRPTVEAALRDVGLVEPDLAQCLKDKLPDDLLARDFQIAGTLGITSTPNFVIGRRDAAGQVVWLKRIQGAQSTELFSSVITGVLTAAPQVSRR
jgi:protein-disulfide isomerase